MKFWKGNRADAEFEMPAAEVAERFIAWLDKQDGATELRADHPLLATGLERLLRHWMTSRGPDGFDSVWEDENRAIFGEESFDGIYDHVWKTIFASKG